MTTTSESLLFRLQNCGKQSEHQSSEKLDEKAWQDFVSLYTPLMFCWARKIGLEQNDAADLVQDVLTRVFQKLPALEYKKTGSFRGWLRMVTINRYREICRRKSHGESPASRSVIEGLLPVEAAESTWDIDYARLLVGQAMEAMKEDFSPATWEALTRVMKDQRSVDDVANETGVSSWTIYSARSRLMKRLREELEGLL